MAIKPILFSTEMVRAIQTDQKTVTRRVIKPRYRDDEYGFRVCWNEIDPSIKWIEKTDEEGRCFDPGRYVHSSYQIGDILYVREAWAEAGTFNPQNGEYSQHYVYKAGYGSNTDCDLPAQKWRPSIHMPRDAARIFLLVTDMRVERLQEITDEQMIAEGVRYTDFGMYTPNYKISIDGGKTFHTCRPMHHPGYHVREVKSPEQCFPTPRGAFANYWGKITKPADLHLYGWDANPWVRVIKFERMQEPPKGFYADKIAAQYAHKPTLAPGA